jgi:hypothetical protein
MTITADELRSIVTCAYQATIDDVEIPENKGGARNRCLSSKWIKNLGDGLIAFETNRCDVPKVYSREHDKEFLFDLAIEDGSKCFGRRLWAVESEFAMRNAHVSRDFAKLLWADVDNRLFIHSTSRRLEIEACAREARVSRGDFYVCNLPHPEGWPLRHNEAISLFAIKDGGLCQL